MYSPERKNLMPANCNGVVYFKPILIPTNADDHKRQAIIARNVVLSNLALKLIAGFKFQISCKDSFLSYIIFTMN